MHTHHAARRLLAILIVAGLMTGAGLPDARAGRRHHHHGYSDGWATTGKILTGVLAVDLLFNHLPAWGVCERATMAYPAPVVVEQRYVQVTPAPPPGPLAPPPGAAPAPPPPATEPPPPPPAQPGPRTWHEGHFTYVPKQVWVDATTQVEDWVQGYRRADGVWVDGHKVRRVIPGGFWRTSEERVWVDGYWE